MIKRICAHHCTEQNTILMLRKVMSTFRFFVSEAFRFFAFVKKTRNFFMLSSNAAPAHKTFIYAFDHEQM
jgi:hypothetical protein